MYKQKLSLPRRWGHEVFRESVTLLLHHPRDFVGAPTSAVWNSSLEEHSQSTHDTISHAVRRSIPDLRPK
jgi:hypothetical protein